MLRDLRTTVGFERVNPVVPAAVCLFGLLCFASGRFTVGGGVVAGALLAWLNSLVLSGRVEMAADAGDVGRSLLVMQLGLLLSCTVIGVATVVLVRISLSMAVACAFSFVVSHLAILGVFYWTRARVQSGFEGEPS